MALKPKNEALYRPPQLFLQFQDVFHRKNVGGTCPYFCHPTLQNRPLAHGLFAVTFILIKHPTLHLPLIHIL